MRQVWVIFSEELRRARSSPATWMLFALFYLVSGAFYFSVFRLASMEPQRYSPLQLFWEMQWLLNLIWVPLLTMRLIAPDRNRGLLESALATPTTPAAIVMGKYLSVLYLYILGWLSVGVYMLISRLTALNAADAAIAFSPSAVWGGAIFCLSSGVFFLSLGLWCSSLTRNTIIAGGLTVCLMLLYMMLPTMFEQAAVHHVGALNPFNHLENLSDYVSGEISISMVVAHFIMSAILLFTTMLSIEHKAE